jgi:hypothetical protein
MIIAIKRKTEQNNMSRTISEASGMKEIRAITEAGLLPRQRPNQDTKNRSLRKKKMRDFLNNLMAMDPTPKINITQMKTILRES